MKHSREGSELSSLSLEREEKRMRTMSQDFYPLHQYHGSNITSPMMTAAAAADEATAHGALMLSLLSSLAAAADFANPTSTSSTSSGLLTPIMPAPPSSSSTREMMMTSLHYGGSNDFNNNNNNNHNSFRSRAPLPYKSFHLEQPHSKTTKNNEHWMNVCRPLPGPPKLPSPSEAIKASVISSLQ